MKALLLVGAGGHGRVVADLAETLGWQTIAFLDDNWPERAENRRWPIVGKVDDLARVSPEYSGVAISVGINDRRLSLHRRLVQLSLAVPTLIHPSAVVSRHATLGRGSVVLANAVINAFAKIGEAVILNTASTIDHDCIVSDGVHVAPGAHLSGGVTVGEGSWIGVGASVRENLTIGTDTVIGTGSAVVKDIGDGIVAMGVPARPRP